MPVSTVGPSRWRVVWGSWLRPGFTQEIVEAFDVDEALAIAAERRPELWRPRVAFLVADPSDVEGALPYTSRP